MINDQDILKEVSPDHYFLANNGVVIKSVTELKEALTRMDANTFNHHVNNERNDFSEWIKHVILDIDLARDVGKAKSKDNIINIIYKKIKESEKIIKKFSLKKTTEKESAIKKEVLEEKEDKTQVVKKIDDSILPKSIPLEKIDEILRRELEIEKREEKISEIEERIEKQLKDMKKESKVGDSFFSKEFIQGVVIGILIAVIFFLIYIKFLS